MSKVTFASSEDAAQLGKLFHDDMANQGIDRPLKELIKMAQAAIEITLSPDPNTIIWVIREKKKVVGVLLVNMAMSLKFAGRSIWIEELYVPPESRRKGYGKALINHLLDFAESDPSICGIDLEAYQGNTPASILYRSLGFKRLGRERFYYFLGESDYL